MVEYVYENSNIWTWNLGGQVIIIEIKGERKVILYMNLVGKYDWKIDL